MKKKDVTDMSITTADIEEHLFKISDADYKAFHSGLVPDCKTLIGVRVPVLRQYARELLKGNTAEFLLSVVGENWYEEQMLKGMLIGLQPTPQWEQVKRQIEEFVPLIDNWAVCDTFCAGLKITKKKKEEVYELIEVYIRSEKEFERRFAVVMLLDYYVEEGYLRQIFELIDGMNRDGYYVQMAVAWALSVCLVKYYEQTLSYLSGCKLEDFTYNKTLQKGIESYRLTKEQKECLRNKKERRYKDERKSKKK